MTMTRIAPPRRRRYTFAITLAAAICAAAFGDAPEHGTRAGALVIRGGMMVEGPGTPAEGPVDVFVRGDRIERIAVSGRPMPNGYADAAVIDATDQYVLPGFINMHGHIHDTWLGRPSSLEYIYKLWLACGITTVRDVGSRTALTVGERERSAAGGIVAPRILLYFFFRGIETDGESIAPEAMTAAQLQEAVRGMKRDGADGIKLRHFDRETVRVIMDEARAQGLKVAHHVGIEDLDAWDLAEFGTSTIEHWYGVPDAAIGRVQSFPADFNHNNELHRFRYAGRIWREIDPKRLEAVLERLVEAKVAWDPTFAIYEACRDLQRATSQPWFDAFLHPGLARYFEPNPSSHGSFFFGWTHTDEVAWRENFRLWMDAVKRFEEKGGVVTTGEDAGYIYQMYGFCYLRELELHEEAGFHPLEVIQHATVNGAKVLGKDGELGRIRPGYLADLVVVDGNPLANLRILYPRGIDETLDLQTQGHGGIAWTIKDGIPYRPAVLLEEVKGIVAEATAAITKE